MHQQALPGATAAKRYVAELNVGERVESSFLLRRCSLGTTRNGDPFLKLELADKSGSVGGRLWDNAEATAATVREGDYVHVVGMVESYQSRPQIKVERLEAADPETIDPADYLPVSSRDAGEMYAELLGHIAGVGDNHLRALLEATFGHPEVAALFRRAPGGIKLHHAWVGGLLEHTLSVIGLARQVGDHYDAIDTDLLVTGACLHDLGKIWELAFEHGFDYTDEGRLVGHIVLASNWLSRRMEEIDGFPDELRHHVLHLVASHHGIFEHGAPVQPITREALALHYIDDLDSKMGAIETAVAEARATGADTAYSRSLNRRVLRRQRNEVEE